MTDDTTTQCVLFPELFKKAVVAVFDQERGSSDGGAILLKAIDEPLEAERRACGMPGRAAGARQDRP